MVTDNQIFEFSLNKNSNLPVITIEDIWEIALQAYFIRNLPNIWVTVYFDSDQIHIHNDLSIRVEGENVLLWHYAHLIQETAKTIGKLSTLMSLEPSKDY